MIFPEKICNNGKEKNLLQKVEMDIFSEKNNKDCVLMPWDDQSTIIVLEDDNITEAYSRWELIQKQLSTSKISNVEDLFNIIKSYNVMFEKNGQQVKSYWKFTVLHQYFAKLDETERKKFFEENGVLSTIRNLSLRLRELVPKLEILKMGHSSSIKLHQIQIASILSNAFFCTFPRGRADCPLINFNKLYEGFYGPVLEYSIEKIKCLMHYFKRIHIREPMGNLSFHRFNIPDHKFPRWDKTTENLCSLKVNDEGKIEDQVGYLQMDFANKYVGGGVLGKGCFQEEIRFLISPELIATRLFTECLADNESLFVVGAERYCNYTGYSDTFAFAGNFDDATPFDENRRRKTYLIILDALYFHHSLDQYRESKILRELKKAYVGFKPLEEFKILPLATGNWGCGAFGGDPQLKALLQLIACSQARRDMLYLTFGNSVFKNKIEELYFILKRKAVNIGMLYRIIRLYNRERKKNQTVFEFVIASVNKLEDNKQNNKLFLKSIPSTSREILSNSKRERSSLEKITKAKFKLEKRRPHEETTAENFFEMDIDFESLDKEIQIKSKDVLTNCHPSTSSNHTFSQQKSPECSGILDVIWFENEFHFNKNLKEEDNEKPNSMQKFSVHKEKSSSLFADEEMEISDENSEKNFPNFLKTESITFSDSSHYQKTHKKENEIIQNPQHQKIVQRKITDCFFKKEK